MRRAARTDGPHKAITDALRACGCAVHDTSRLGGGFPDLVVSLGKRLALVEVKDGAKSPSRRRLTDAEADFKALFGDHVVLIESVAEAIAWAQNKGGK